MTSSPISPSPRVAPRASTPSLVDERDREPVDLRLAHVLELAPRIPSRASWLRIRSTQARSSSSLRALRQREHRLQVADLLERASGLAPTRCVGESGVTQLGMLGLERAQLVEQLVVDVVADLPGRRGRSSGGCGARARAAARPPARPAPSSRARVTASSLDSRAAAGRQQAARGRTARSASMPERSVRSKWIGVTAIRPVARRRRGRCPPRRRSRCRRRRSGTGARPPSRPRPAARAVAVDALAQPRHLDAVGLAARGTLMFSSVPAGSGTLLELLDDAGPTNARRGSKSNARPEAEVHLAAPSTAARRRSPAGRARSPRARRRPCPSR